MVRQQKKTPNIENLQKKNTNIFYKIRYSTGLQSEDSLKFTKITLVFSHLKILL